jgi:hypothetical protein
MLVNIWDLQLEVADRAGIALCQAHNGYAAKGAFAKAVVNKERDLVTVSLIKVDQNLDDTILADIELQIEIEMNLIFPHNPVTMEMKYNG